MPQTIEYFPEELDFTLNPQDLLDLFEAVADEEDVDEDEEDEDFDIENMNPDPIYDNNALYEDIAPPVPELVRQNAMEFPVTDDDVFAWVSTHPSISSNLWKPKKTKTSSHSPRPFLIFCDKGKKLNKKFS